MLFPFLASPPKTHYPMPLLLLTNPPTPASLSWHGTRSIEPSQDLRPLLSLMFNKAILCYVCCWSHGSLHVYSGWWFSPWEISGVWWVHIFVLPMGLQTPSLPWVLFLTPPLGSLCSVQWLAESIHLCIYILIFPLDRNASKGQQAIIIKLYSRKINRKRNTYRHIYAQAHACRCTYIHRHTHRHINTHTHTHTNSHTHTLIWTTKSIGWIFNESSTTLWLESCSFKCTVFENVHVAYYNILFKEVSTEKFYDWSLWKFVL
jgi:hypothetical protein